MMVLRTALKWTGCLLVFSFNRFRG